MTERLNITLGTAGHVDHGKTALVRNMTGCETDLLKEEKERGMSIDLGHAPFFFGQYEVGVVDVPGHESFIRTMVAGATGMDCVLFVVAADDGVMPQTREHLDILSLLGVRNGIIAMTKIDRVSPERRSEAEAQIRAQVAGTFLADSPLVPVSNITGEGLSDLAAELGRVLPAITRRDTGGPFRMPVDRSFAVKGFGTVVTGIAVSGSASVGDELELFHQSNPVPVPGRLRSVQVYSETAQRALAGQCAALNVPQWSHGEIQRGDVVVVPGFFAPYEWVLCQLRVLPGEKALRNGERIRFHAGTSDVTGAVFLLQPGPLTPGAQAVVQIRLDTPLVLGPNDPFIVRLQTPPHTIAGGRVLEGLAHRLKRAREETLRYAAEKSESITSPQRSVEICLRRKGMAGANAEDLAQETKMLIAETAAALEILKREGVAVDAGRSVMHREAVQEAAQKVLDALGDFHKKNPRLPGIAKTPFAAQCGIPPVAFETALVSLSREKKIEYSEITRRFSVAEWESVLPPQIARLCEQIEKLFHERLFNPPSLEELLAATGASERDCREAQKILLEQARIVTTPGNILFHAKAVTAAAAKVVAHIEKEGRLESVDFKYLLDTTRKYALPLLDHLDAIGVTRRVGNTRLLKKV